MPSTVLESHAALIDGGIGSLAQTILQTAESIVWNPKSPADGDNLSQANRLIKPNEELTFDYANASGQEQESHPDNSDPDPNKCQTPPNTEYKDCENRLEDGKTKRTRCLCGTNNCRGWMAYDETL